MINCPKCKVPNPDKSTVCVSCGAMLADQLFARVLDEASEKNTTPRINEPNNLPPASKNPPPIRIPNIPEKGPTLEETSPVYQASSSSPLSGPSSDVSSPESPGPPVFNPQTPPPSKPTTYSGITGEGFSATGHADVAQFLNEQKARRRKKTIMYGALAISLIAIGGFSYLQKKRKEAKRAAVIKFFKAFREIDGGAVAEFWRCTVRAKIRDVHLARDSSEITNGLEQAFENFPRSQPERLFNTCLPMLKNIMTDINKLEKPPGFSTHLERYKDVMEEIKINFSAYARRLDERKRVAANEKEIRAAHRDFHSTVGAGGRWSDRAAVPKAIAYFNILNCAIPNLFNHVRQIRRPPDTQYVVETIYNSCKKDSQFADKLRRECFGDRLKTNKWSANFRLAAQKMSGDERDLYAIDDCFKRANHGFAFEELKRIAEVFAKYRNEARGKILSEIQKIGQEAGH